MGQESDGEEEESTKERRYQRRLTMRWRAGERASFQRRTCTALTRAADATRAKALRTGAETARGGGGARCTHSNTASSCVSSPRAPLNGTSDRVVDLLVILALRGDVDRLQLARSRTQTDETDVGRDANLARSLELGGRRVDGRSAHILYEPHSCAIGLDQVEATERQWDQLLCSTHQLLRQAAQACQHHGRFEQRLLRRSLGKHRNACARLIHCRRRSSTDVRDSVRSGPTTTSGSSASGAAARATVCNVCVVAMPATITATTTTITTTTTTTTTIATGILEQPLRNVDESIVLRLHPHLLTRRCQHVQLSRHDTAQSAQQRRIGLLKGAAAATAVRNHHRHHLPRVR
eukprot:4944057-Pleurochrysis_carterae.AAC.2